MQGKSLLHDLDDLDDPTVAALADLHDIESATLIDETAFEMPLTNAQMQLIDALRLIGPETFDDSEKWNAVQGIITAMYLIDRYSGGEESKRLYPNEGTDGNSVIDMGDGFGYLLTGESPNRVGQYNPMMEVDDREEPTIKDLATSYKVGQRIEELPEELPTAKIQVELATAITEIAGTDHNATNLAQKYILSAMLFVDHSHNYDTLLELETVTHTHTIEREDGPEEFEFDREQVTVTEQTRPKQ